MIGLKFEPLLFCDNDFICENKVFILIFYHSILCCNCQYKYTYKQFQFYLFWSILTYTFLVAKITNILSVKWKVLYFDRLFINLML